MGYLGRLPLASQGGPFNQDWSPKPSDKVYEDLVLHDWWTNADGATDATGSYPVRGFLGDYEVTVTQGSKP